MRYVMLLSVFTSFLQAETFPVILEKTLWRDRNGTIEIDDQGITYTTQKKEQNRVWKWTDIQYFDRVSSKEFVVLTYEDNRRLLGRDKQYHFRITQGELSNGLFDTVSKHLNRPLTDRVVPENVTARYTIPVKHEHVFGGCEGDLEFTADAIYYVTTHAPDGRVWHMDRDIVQVWSDDPYRLEIRAYDNNRREFSSTAAYKFELKEKLDPAFYRELKLKLYNLESNNHVIR
jgi:hypothetical protein